MGRTGEEATEDAPVASVVSWTGAEAVHFRFRRRFVTRDGEGAILVDLRATGSMWRRDQAKTEGELVDDFEVRLPQAIAATRALERLRSKLLMWLHDERPFSELVSPPREPLLELRVEDDGRFAKQPGKPVFTMKYTTQGTVTAETSFVVDASCLRLFSQELAQALAKIGEPVIS